MVVLSPAAQHAPDSARASRTNLGSSERLGIQAGMQRVVRLRLLGRGVGHARLSIDVVARQHLRAYLHLRPVSALVLVVIALIYRGAIRRPEAAQVTERRVTLLVCAEELARGNHIVVVGFHATITAEVVSRYMILQNTQPTSAGGFYLSLPLSLPDHGGMAATELHRTTYTYTGRGNRGEARHLVQLLPYGSLQHR